MSKRSPVALSKPHGVFHVVLTCVFYKMVFLVSLTFTETYTAVLVFFLRIHFRYLRLVEAAFQDMARLLASTCFYRTYCIEQVNNDSILSSCS